MSVILGIQVIGEAQDEESMGNALKSLGQVGAKIIDGHSLDVVNQAALIAEIELLLEWLRLNNN